MESPASGITGMYSRSEDVVGGVDVTGSCLSRAWHVPGTRWLCKRPTFRRAVCEWSVPGSNR